MAPISRQKRLHCNSMWIISEGSYSDFDLNDIHEADGSGPVTEYRISDFARYLLCPHPIEIKKKLIGSELLPKPSFSDNLKERIRQCLPAGLRSRVKARQVFPDVLFSDTPVFSSPLKDQKLEFYVTQLEDRLNTHDPVLKKLSKLNLNQYAEIIGICEGFDGSRSQLTLKGSLAEKLDFIERNLLKNVNVRIQKAHISDGLFETGGYDFKSFDPNRSFRLIKYFKNCKPAGCVLNASNHIVFRLDNISGIHYLLLLQLSLETNPNLIDAFRLCITGKAVPAKLFFNDRIEIDYSTSYTPEVYKNVFKTHAIGFGEKKIILDLINKLQTGIAFNYIPHFDMGDQRIFTNISVMHNLKALEPIKNALPQLYSEINAKASASETGKYYLLDCIKGYRNE